MLAFDLWRTAGREPMMLIVLREPRDRLVDEPYKSRRSKVFSLIIAVSDEKKILCKTYPGLDLNSVKAFSCALHNLFPK